MIYIQGSPQSFMQYNVYMIYTRGSPQSFMQYNVYICCIFEEVLRVLCNAMFIYDLHSRKSSEFHAMQFLYTIYIRGSPQSFMLYNVYI